MTLHREGKASISLALLAFILINGSLYLALGGLSLIGYIVLAITFIPLALVVWFFRIPSRVLTEGEGLVVCPADGKVVVIEETEDTECLTGRRMQVSVFMSPVNVHVNRYPVSGEVTYSKYHPGKYLVAWHPKSSTENERTSVVIKDKKGREILMRQIAGALARRIVCYSKQGDVAKQSSEMGFIKFGSRVDLYLPLDAKIEVELGQKVKGGITTIARLD